LSKYGMISTSSNVDFLTVWANSERRSCFLPIN
jgi:hypothetical protein